MATIYPERLPQSIIEDPLRNAERKLFLALRNLPKQYRVFYSMHWQAYREDRGVIEGEADFIIAHPDLGVLVLEVKGGGIIYNAEKGQWLSQSWDGELHEIRDPIEQGRRNHYELKRKFENIPGWSPRKLNIWHAVCFPDIYLKRGQWLKPDLPREIIVDADDLTDISSAIDRLFRYCFSEEMADGAPGQDRIRLIEGLLANSFQIRTPLGIEMEKEDEKLVELTEQQFRALAILGDRKRAAITGCAGSGKTLLATRKAQQFADLGMSVLLVCFNIALAEDLQRRLPCIEVYTFHELCRKAVEQAGHPLKTPRNDDELYDVILPEALLEAADQLGRLYDAIIVDEGQDFQENYWIALESLLKEDGYLYIFYDDNQNLYGGSENFSGLISEPAFPLYQNCRNTKAIHKLVARFHSNPKGLQCFSPEGREPEDLTYTGEDDLLRKIQKLLHNLVIEEHIDFQDIVILTPRGEKSTKLVPDLKLGSFTLTNYPPTKPYQIQATSVYKFKGLERRVVILAEVDQRTNYNRDMLMYVGCSRARTHLIILADENAPHMIKERMKPDT